MEHIQSYTDPMDDDNDGNHHTSTDDASTTVNLFRIKSLLLATFPWFTVVNMVPSKLVECLGGSREEHYSFHLANSLDNYDSFLESQNIHNSPLKALLRDVNADPMSDMSAVAISKRETSMLRSRERSNDFCSMLCAYRLLDVIAHVCAPGVTNTPPLHMQMGINFFHNERDLRPFEDWTIILKKFRQNFTNSKSESAIVVDSSDTDLPSRQIQALFNLHSNLNVNKTLINMQLAATHIAYMVQKQTEEHIIPDFPGTLQEIKDLVLKASLSSNGDGTDHIVAFLEGLGGGNEKIDNLRLPLQVALLISPIFLLQDVQMHLSSFYAQRHKIVLYSKALGNDRPNIVSEIEKIIWSEIFNIANGEQTVHDAASNIVDRIPELYDHFDAEMCRWFMLTSTAKKEELINLSSFSVKPSTLPIDWPCSTILQTGGSVIQSSSLTQVGGSAQEGDDASDPISKKRKRTNTATPSTSLIKSPKKSIGRSKSKPKTSRSSFVSRSRPRTVTVTPQTLPFIVGNIYLKVENFDLEELSMLKLSPTKDVPFSENTSDLSQFSAHFNTFNVHGGRLEHTFTTPFEKVIGAINKFLQKIEGKFTFGEHILCAENERPPTVKAIRYETIQQMSPQSFQEELRSKHIIIAENNLPSISCDRRGLMTLNSLKEIVNIEDQSMSNMPQLKGGILKQFVDNLEFNNPNILRIIRMRSYFGAESCLFSSDHVAWRETVFNPYCSYDSLEESSLRWTDVSTANAIQFWRIAPSGFGIFLDIRSGCQLVIIATTECANNERGKDFFTQWGHYLQDFDHSDSELFSENNFEAIRLEPGNRLVLRPNTPYVLISLENTIVTGGFFLSSHTLYETLMGRIHSFVLPLLLTEGKNPPFTIYIRRIAHYMHNAYVVNDSSDRSHLLSFLSLDDARDLLALVAMGIFLNVLDERTYQCSLEAHQDDPTALQQCHDIFDLNAISVVERHHLCYIRGILLDLLEWFFENFSFSSADLEEDDIDAHRMIFIPFVVHIGRQIMKYKRAAEKRGYTTLSKFEEVNRQIQLALFSLDSARDTWLEDKAAEEEKIHDDESYGMDTHDLDYDISGYTISRRENPAERSSCDNFVEKGKTKADDRFFRGLSSQFNHEDIALSEGEDSQYLSS